MQSLPGFLPRIMTFRRNTHRLPPRSRSGLKGVIYFPRCKYSPWKAYIRHHGQYVCLGYFATKEDAARAYDAKAKQIYGEETYLNRV
jgi:AP2 domain